MSYYNGKIISIWLSEKLVVDGKIHYTMYRSKMFITIISFTRILVNFLSMFKIWKIRMQHYLHRTFAEPAAPWCKIYLSDFFWIWLWIGLMFVYTVVTVISKIRHLKNNVSLKHISLMQRKFVTSSHGTTKSTDTKRVKYSKSLYKT